MALKYSWFLINFLLLKCLASDRFGNVYFTDQPNDKIYFGIGKPIKLQNLEQEVEEQTELF